MNWLSQITPKQFFVASVIYAILAVVLGFWLLGFDRAFLFMAMMFVIFRLMNWFIKIARNKV